MSFFLLVICIVFGMIWICGKIENKKQKNDRVFKEENEMKVIVITAEHKYEFFTTNGKLFCFIDDEELRGPCKLIGKKEIKIGESIDVICEREENDFYTSPVETVDVIFE